MFNLTGQKLGLHGKLYPKLETLHLLDQKREAWDQYQTLLPAAMGPNRLVFILHCCGSLFSALAEQDDQVLISGEEIVSWLEFIELRCPAGGVPDWPSGLETKTEDIKKPRRFEND